MPGDQIPCPVCGRMFTPCKTDLRNVWNWRRYTCSWDCSEKYTAMIQAQRAAARATKTEQNKD